MSDNDTKLVLPGAKFAGSNWLPSVISRVLEHCTSEPVKLFALDVELSNVPGKTNSDKLISIKKIFYRIDGFGEASTLSKFLGIIWSTFTNGSSLNKAREMAINEKIIVNDDFKKINNHLDREIIIKEIPLDLSKSAIEAKALVEFEFTETACLVVSKWSVLMGKDSVHVALAISNKKLWISRDCYCALLYTLLVGTTAYDLFELVEAYGGKTCFIGQNPSSYVRDRCVVICFESKTFKLAAIDFVPVFKDMIALNANNLVILQSTVLWVGILVSDWVCLVGIYKKKLAPISCLVSFTGKTWAQVAEGLNSYMVLLSPGSGSLLAVVPLPQFSLDVNNKFATLEYSFASLAEQINKLAKRLDAFRLTVFQHGSGCQPLMTPSSQNQGADTMMSESLGVTTSGGTVAEVVVYNSSAVSKLKDTLDILSKTVMGLLARLENAVATCNVQDINNFTKQEDIVHWHKDLCNLVFILMETKLKDKACPWLASKFNGVCVFSSDLASGYTKASVMMVLDNSLAKHISKNKLLVSILGLYADASLTAWFSQAAEINFLITRAVNESFFVILGGDFNEDSFRKCTSLKKCFNLSLYNSHGVAKTINYMFISSNLIGVVIDHSMAAVNDYFDTDYKAVSVSMGLGGLLDVQLNFLCKQTNRDCWKYNFMSADSAKWIKFKEDMTANTAMFCDKFGATERIVCLSAESVFKKKWFKDYDSVFNRASSRFHKLELLVSRIVKTLRLASHDEFVSLLGLWSGLDSTNASVVKSLFLSGFHFDAIWSVLAKIRKSYCLSKLLELDHTRESQIRLAIDRRMESFELNKSHTIRSVLECSFCKVVLDHLVVGNELILESNLVKSKVVIDVSSDWNYQYQSLNYVFDEAFSGVMSSISFDELFGVVSGLLNGKCCNRSVLNMLLVLLNSCLSCESVPCSWKKKSVLTNTRPIALIETARKILFKILSDRISLACSAFDIFRGDNFSVLKGTSTQFPIFAVGSIVKNVLEKDCELWLILQNMKKVYNLVSWEHLSKCLVRIKMCDKFIWFFSVMTDFGLMSGYYVHDDLDQREGSVCEYRLNFYFISKSGHAESQVRFSTFFAAVGSSLKAIQHIFNVAMAIPINSRVSNLSLFISGSPISIAKKGESHRYLGIFLSTKGLLKPSLVKAHLNICFFTNLVLKKAITDKQLLYLVSAVLYPIVRYRTQFSFVSVGVCNKWDVMIRKALKLKSGLPLNFPGNMIHHPSFYDLKSFLQIQSKDKVVSLISFVNFSGILGHLFSYRSHDLQVLCWHLVHPLSCLARICVSASNNFLAGLVCILFDCNLSLGGSSANAFSFNGGVSMSAVLGKLRFFKFLSSLQHYGIAFIDQLHDCYSSFRLSAAFLDGVTSFSAPFLVLDNIGPLNILSSDEFLSVCDHLLCVETGCLSVYMDGSLRNLGMVGCKAGTTAFFEDIGLSLGIGMSDLMLFTLAELQAIALALECVPPFSLVHLFSDNQSVLDVYKLELGLLHPDFCSQCWVECQHIVNLIHRKNLRVSWHKVKGHSGIEGNEQADVIAGSDSLSSWFLPPRLDEHFLVADGVVISGNSRCFHLDLHMAAGFTSRVSANVRTYFIKALHHQLPVAVHKRLYNRFYSSVLCLYCSEALSGLSHSSSSVLCLLSSCVSGSLVSAALHKGFVFNDWFCEAVFVFHDPKVAGSKVVKFMHSLGLAFRNNIWLVRAKHCAYMEKNRLISLDGLILISLPGLSSKFSADVVNLLEMVEAFGVSFGYHKCCLFFSGIDDSVSVHIVV
ncbi:hypothetical protein G9A89_009029 [Geosiphon pyriformis]|nr:hypothetical protein G9A89_009029 [Geosiphon pyriformis]